MPRARCISALCSMSVMPVMVAVLVHAGLDVLLIAFPWNLGRPLMLAALAISISQNSMIALWASTHSSPSYLRFIGLSLGLVATWRVALTVISDGMASRAAAGWALAFVVGSLVIVLTAVLLRLPVRLGLRSGYVRSAAGGKRFSLATLLLWTAAVTVPLMLLRLAVEQLGWTIGTLSGWQFMPHLAVLGTFNGMFAVVVLISLKLRGFALLRVACGGLFVLGLALFEAYLFEYLFANPGGMDVDSALQFAGAQLVVLYGTLGPLHWAASRRNRGRSAIRRASTAPSPVTLDEVRITPAE